MFINKLDRLGADVSRVREDIAALGAKHVMMRSVAEAPHALKQALRNAGTQILEPIYYYESVVTRNFAVNWQTKLKTTRAVLLP